MEPQEILDETRKAIDAYAGEDPDKRFYANRFVFARLQLDERRTKTKIKGQLLDTRPVCDYCKETFPTKTGIHLHRVDGAFGYSLRNCVLMHRECHTKYHAENPSGRRPGRPASRHTVIDASPVLEKSSKRYEGQSFLYWWDLSPGFLDKMDGYEAVEFVKKDSGERCHVPTQALKGYLTEDRKTSRSNGNWGIKVLKDREDELAFEPGKDTDKWLYLPVVWVNDTQED